MEALKTEKYPSESKIGRRANRSVPRGADRMEETQTQKWEKQTGEEADFGKTIDGLSVLRERKQILEREKRNSFLPRAIKVFGKQTLVVSFRASVCVPYSEPFPIPLPPFSSLSGIEKTSVLYPSLCTSGNVSLWKLQPNQITRHSLFPAQQLFPGTLNIHGLLATQLIPLRFGWKQDFSLVFAYLK